VPKPCKGGKVTHLGRTGGKNGNREKKLRVRKKGRTKSVLVVVQLVNGGLGVSLKRTNYAIQKDGVTGGKLRERSIAVKILRNWFGVSES